MNRREFLSGCSKVFVGGMLISNDFLKIDMSSSSLKGFIVSDAHFGWEGAVQPSVSTQIEMIRRIRARFPDLDLLIDTGDAHHGGDQATDADKGDWTDVILGGCPHLPFYYVTGNHEVTGTGRGFEPEWTANILGSVSCRPYYSFDLCGIHFISMPELVRAVYINEETIRWVKLDLELNKDKTTILLSHNNLLETTSRDVPGYRGVINTDEIMALLAPYPNAVAWMHGHNHDYDILEKHDRLYVSNGRIGGFDPSNGKHGLGGIYFEIDDKQLKVAPYSAEFNCFVGDLEEPIKTHIMKINNSSYNPKAPAAHSYGTGAAADGQRVSVMHHTAASTGNTKLFFGGLEGDVLNDDSQVKYHAVRNPDRPDGGHWQLMGCSVSGGAGVYEWTDPGLKLLPTNEVRTMHCPHRGHHQYTYYRLNPNKQYKFILDIDAEVGGQKAKLDFFVHNRSGRELASIDGPEWVLQGGPETIEHEIDFPSLEHETTIYTDIQSDEEINVSARVNFSNLQNSVQINDFIIVFSDPGGSVTQNPALIIGSEQYEYNGTLAANETASIDISSVSQSRRVYQAQCQGNKRFVWLICQTGCDWQVRNAPVADKGDYLEVGPMRNRFQAEPYIIIAPFVKTTEPYANRLYNVEKAKVYPINRNNAKLKLKIDELVDSSKPSRIEVISPKKPENVTGATGWKFRNGLLAITANQGQEIEIEYS